MDRPSCLSHPKGDVGTKEHIILIHNSHVYNVKYIYIYIYICVYMYKIAAINIVTWILWFVCLQC